MNKQILKLSFAAIFFLSLNSEAIAQKVFNDTMLVRVTIPGLLIDGDFGPAVFNADVKFKSREQKGWSAFSQEPKKSKFRLKVAVKSDDNLFAKMKKGSKIESLKLENEGWERDVVLKRGVVKNLKTTGDINILIVQFECWPCK